MRVSVIIPALNEQEAISKVLSEIPEYVFEVVVVDNGSEDLTSRIARERGAKVVYEERRGYGYALLAGIKNLTPCDVVVFMEGDYSDYPEDMKLLLDEIEKGYDLVLGSRMRRGEKDSLPPHSVLANSIFTFLIRLLYSKAISDLGPFRAIKYEKLIELDMRDKAYGWTSEMVCKALSKEFRVGEVDVRHRERVGTSKITGSLKTSLRAGLRVTYYILRFAF
ncbi:MAG: glycosyltransferase family 2 protein [Candidatus Methanofastidiosia archaeon]